MQHLQVIAVGIIDILALLMLGYLIRHSAILPLRRLQVYLDVIAMIIVIILAEAGTLLLEGAVFPGARGLHLAANAVGFTVSVLLPPLLALLLSESGRWPVRILLAPAVLVAILSFSSPVTGWLFSVTPDNFYLRGPAFGAFIAAYLYGFAFLLLATLTQAYRFDRSEGIYLFCLVLLLMAGTSFQVLFPTVYTSWHCVTISLILYYLFLRELSSKYDVVTGVLCRAAFEQQLGLLPETGSAVLIFDLNDFKLVNDTFGHEMGDRCLAAAGRLLQLTFRPLGKCYRLGGDEFAVLAPVYDERLLEKCAGAMLDSIAAERQNLPMLPYISYGCGVCRGSVSAARQEADAQMYRYKYRTKPFPRKKTP